MPGSCRPFCHPLATGDASAAVTVSVPVPANMAAYLKALTAVSRSAAAAAPTHNPAAVLAPTSVCQHRLQQRNCKSASDSYYLYRADYIIRFSPSSFTTRMWSPGAVTHLDGASGKAERAGRCVREGRQKVDVADWLAAISDS